MQALTTIPEIRGELPVEIFPVHAGSNFPTISEKWQAVR